MTDLIMNDLTTVRLSTTVYKLTVWKDEAKTEPQSLESLPLLLIAKKKLSDADDDAVFSLAIGSGLAIDTEVTDGNGLVVTIGSTDTASLSETKDTTLYCELLVTGTERKTLGYRFTIPVLASLKRS